MTEQPLDLYADDAPAPKTATQQRVFTPFGVVITLAAILMIAVVVWGIYQNSLSQPTGGPAPEFILPLMGSEGEFSLADQRGQVVVVNFWGSWCGPCRIEAPMLQRTYELYQDEGVEFVGIAVKDIESDALAYMAEFGITYPNVMDTGAKLEDEYRTEGVPETFIIGKDGKITEFFLAQPSESQLHEAIEAALQES